MAINTSDNITVVSHMEKENTFGKTETITRANLRMDFAKDSVSGKYPQRPFTKATSRATLNMDTESKSLKMVIFMKVNTIKE